MRKIRCIFVVLSIISAVVFFSLSTIADTSVQMADMHEIDSDYVKLVTKTITDSYGNEYSGNIVRFSSGSKGYIVYDLGGSYSRFDATIVCSNDADSYDAVDVGIFADGILVYSLKKYTRQQPPVSVNLDVTGVGTLSIKTASGGYIYFVNSYFNRVSKAGIYPTRWDLVDQIIVDSQKCKTSKELMIDSYGDLHNGYVQLRSSYNNAESYVLFNLDAKYNKLTGNILPAPDTYKEAKGTLVFYLDGKEVYRRKNITKTSTAKAFSINVTNARVLKIVLINNSDYSCYFDITDTTLRVHEHALSDWETVNEPSCLSVGKRVRRCKECGKELEVESLPALGHEADGTWVTTREATCIQEGEEVQHCKVCHDVCNKRNIPVVSHIPNSKWEIEKNPTCVEQGSKVRKCSQCGLVIEREYIDALDHDFGKWIVVRGSKWNNPIVEERECSLCGEIEQRESSPTPWLKPLVIIVIVVLTIGVTVFCVLIKCFYLPLRPSSVKKLFKSKPLTDEELERLINKPNDGE